LILDKVSDWECLQHSPPRTRSTRPCYAFNEYEPSRRNRRAKYGIQGDGIISDARRDRSIFFQTHPGCWAALFSIVRGHVPKSFAINTGSFQKQSSTEGHAAFLRAWFYLAHAMMFDVPAMRSGAFWLADTRGFALRRNFNGKADRNGRVGIAFKRLSRFIAQGVGWIVYSSRHVRNHGCSDSRNVMNMPPSFDSMPKQSNVVGF